MGLKLSEAVPNIHPFLIAQSPALVLGCGDSGQIKVSLGRGGLRSFMNISKCIRSATRLGTRGDEVGKPALL